MTFDLGLDGQVRPDESGYERVEDEFGDLGRAPACVRAGLLEKRTAVWAWGGAQTEQQERDSTCEYEVDFGDDHREELRLRVVEPTTEERRIHRFTHCKYRSWCVECASGAANLDC